MDRTPYLDQLRLVDVAAMTADDAVAYVAARAREAVPRYPAHGTPVGRILFELFGQTCEARLLSTGKHCRSYGVDVDGRVVGVMGADRAWRIVVSPAVGRAHSIRHCL